jgi:hypothetical protein
MNQTLNGSVMNTVVSVGMTRMNAEGGGAGLRNGSSSSVGRQRRSDREADQ